MQIVINISEELYRDLKEAITSLQQNGVDFSQMSSYVLSIINGIPLPKRHGRLIDADALLNNSNIYTIWLDGVYKDCILTDVINNGPTIIEAETEDKNA